MEQRITGLLRSVYIQQPETLPQYKPSNTGDSSVTSYRRNTVSVLCWMCSLCCNLQPETQTQKINKTSALFQNCNTRAAAVLWSHTGVKLKRSCWNVTLVEVKVSCSRLDVWQSSAASLILIITHQHFTSDCLLLLDSSQISFLLFLDKMNVSYSRCCLCVVLTEYRCSLASS